MASFVFPDINVTNITTTGSIFLTTAPTDSSTINALTYESSGQITKNTNLVDLNSSQTLGNKTLAAPLLSGLLVGNVSDPQLGYNPTTHALELLPINTNIAYINANQTFSGNNIFTGANTINGGPTIINTSVQETIPAAGYFSIGLSITSAMTSAPTANNTIISGVTVGQKFSISAPITILTAKIAVNQFQGSGSTRNFGIWNSSETLLFSTVVSNTTIVGNYFVATLSIPWLLNPGTYYVGVQTVSGDFYQSSAATYASAITHINAGQSLSAGFSAPSTVNNLAMGDFDFQIPELYANGNGLTLYSSTLSGPSYITGSSNQTYPTSLPIGVRFDTGQIYIQTDAVTTNQTQILANKTLSSPILSGTMSVPALAAISISDTQSNTTTITAGGTTQQAIAINTVGGTISVPSGSGTVVIGPGSSVTGNFASFNGTSGNIQDSGISSSSVVTSTSTSLTLLNSYIGAQSWSLTTSSNTASTVLTIAMTSGHAALIETIAIVYDSTNNTSGVFKLSSRVTNVSGTVTVNGTIESVSNVDTTFTTDSLTHVESGGNVLVEYAGTTGNTHIAKGTTWIYYE